MAVNLESMIDGLTNLTRAIDEDGKLRQWFFALAQKPLAERRNAIYAMSERLGAQLHDANLVASFKLLAIPKVFEAAQAALGQGD